MKFIKRHLLVLLLGVFVGAAVTLDVAVLAEREPPAAAAAPLPLNELRTFAEVYSRIKSDYVDPVSDKKLLDDAIQGMLSGLDPHSEYLGRSAFKEMRIETEGRFGGLGIEVTMENGFLKVVSPIEGTPAARAGIKPRDLIVRIDQKAVKGMSLNDAVRLMRGKPGSHITLTVLREGSTRPLRFTLTRAVIKIHSVKRHLIAPGYGYVRIIQFQSGTGKSLLDAVKALQKENRRPLRGLVLDLRNNPGGVLNAAVAVADAFLDKGLIVYTKGRASDSHLRFSATPGDVLHGAPMVVLINGGSASASEIVAGALQDHKRAVIMGTRSFGKGSVQTIIPVGDGAALKLTTARYYTPNGRSIQDEGIVPDILAPEGKLTVAEDHDRLHEVDLAHHLTNPEAPTAAAAEPQGGARTKGKRGHDILAGDYQLQEALNVLKGISIFRAQEAQAR